MTEKEKWKADIAWGIARDLRTKLFSGCWRIEVAGSLRRRKEYVGDIELLVVPRFNGPVDLLDRRVRELMYEGVLEARRDKRGRIIYGKKNKLLRHKSGVAIDVFSTTERHWGMALFVRTGPMEWNMRAMSRFRELGMRGHAYGGISDVDNTEIDCPDEETVFRHLGWAYVPPQERH